MLHTYTCTQLPDFLEIATWVCSDLKFSVWTKCAGECSFCKISLLVSTGPLCVSVSGLASVFVSGVHYCVWLQQLTRLSNLTSAGSAHSASYVNLWSHFQKGVTCQPSIQFDTIWIKFKKTNNDFFGLRNADSISEQMRKDQFLS